MIHFSLLFERFTLCECCSTYSSVEGKVSACVQKLGLCLAWRPFLC